MSGEVWGVEAKGVAVTYPGGGGLRAVDVVAAAGEMLAVTGHSGAGKTSALWALVGLVPGEGAHTSGEVETGPASLVAQGGVLPSVLTVTECVLAPLLDLGVPYRRAEELADEALLAVGLEESRSHLADELSGGQQQRVTVATGLARTHALLERGPAVLLADEPTSELDHDNRERVVSLLRAVAQAGACVVVTTHDPEVAAACDAVLDLDHG